MQEDLYGKREVSRQRNEIQLRNIDTELCNGSLHSEYVSSCTKRCLCTKNNIVFL